MSTYAALSVGALAAAFAYAVATRKNYYSVMVFLWSSKLVDLVRKEKREGEREKREMFRF